MAYDGQAESVADWRKLLKTGTFKDQFGEEISLDYFWRLVERKKHFLDEPYVQDVHGPRRENSPWMIIDGYPFSAHDFS
jgi:hypothetical protein